MAQITENKFQILNDLLTHGSEGLRHLEGHEGGYLALRQRGGKEPLVFQRLRKIGALKETLACFMISQSKD